MVSAIVNIKISAANVELVYSEVLKASGEFFDIEKISSMYLVNSSFDFNSDEHVLDRSSPIESYSLGLKVSTELSAKILVKELQKLANRLSDRTSQRIVSINLLVYSDLTLMLPDLTLPHPELHLKPELLIPAIEVWPSYIHPVLNQCLEGLSWRDKDQAWGQFYCQGKSLLDFSSPQK